MTSTIAPSAYPATIETLIPAARNLAVELGELPSHNRLKRELKVGSPKAKALLEALQRNDFVPFAETTTAPVTDPVPATGPTGSADDDNVPVTASAGEGLPLVSPLADPVSNITTIETAPAPRGLRKPVGWPVLLLALPAFVAIWSGWVELGELSGFGVVHPLPGIWDSLTLNTAITLPIGVETYAAYALWVWLSGRAPLKARGFAKWSAIGSLVFGAAGQVAYHLMSAANVAVAPWWITTAVACLPVAVLGMGAALAHLIHADHE